MKAHPAAAGPDGLRAGRLLESPAGLIDLPTGAPVRLLSVAVPASDAPTWQPPAVGAPAADGAGLCIDAWLTQDWLGRWVARLVTLDECRGDASWLRRRAGSRAPRSPAAGQDLRWSDGTVNVTRADSGLSWCRLAASSRSQGLLAVHASMLRSLMTRCDPSRCPPLVVGVPAMGAVCTDDGALTTWVERGGRAAWVVQVHGCLDPVVPPATGDLWSASRLASDGDVRRAAHMRLVRRAWRDLERAPDWPGWIEIGSPAGGRAGMTHLELLDVSTQLDEVRRDEDAFALACRVLQRHTGADHAVLLLAHGSEMRTLASEGPSLDSLMAWRQMAREHGPDTLTASRGWHVVARHPIDDATRLVAGACWSSREAGAGRHVLLPVFARLVAARATATAARVTAVTTPGLEQTLLGVSTAMHDVRAQIALAARAPFPVLIRGESGCGKELAARAIHALGPRRHRRCAAINCAALPDELIESELFGHVRGAFTGATSDRLGLFDEADGGTLFLDEIGELGGRAQAKLLRVLQDGEIRRVGENQPRRVDVRVVAATNVSLEDAVRRGSFRADLFYRLDVVRVRMPALRERREDIPVLARHFWRDCTTRLGSRARLESRVIDALARADWPGNVRQLQNILAALAVSVPPRGRVTMSDLPADVRAPDAEGYLSRSGLGAARREFEASYVRDALVRAGGRSALAARDLGVTRQGLSKLVRRLGLEEGPPGSRLP